MRRKGGFGMAVVKDGAAALTSPCMLPGALVCGTPRAYGACRGACLPALQVSGRPIKFVGTGEKMEALEPFYPERMASRILGAPPVCCLFKPIRRCWETETLIVGFLKGHPGCVSIVVLTQVLCAR
jgi:hypothetical protein